MKIWTIFRKECLDAIRDRRALGVAVLTMLAGPLLVAFLLVGVAGGDATLGPISVSLVGAEHAPDLVRFLTDQRVEPSESTPVRLSIAPDYAEDFRRGQSAAVTIDFDSTARAAGSAAERLRILLARYASEISSLRLMARGVDPIVTKPLDIRVYDHARNSSRSAAAVSMIPMFLLMAVLLGCMNLAIECTAGERERQNLESLLIHPVSAAEIAIGKWLATFSFAAASAIGMLVVLRAVLELPALRRLPILIDCGWSAQLGLALLLLPFAALAAALQLIVALRSRSFKEAQAQLSLLLFAPMVPGFLFAFDPPARLAELSWFPLVGHQLLAGGMLEGADVSWQQLLLLAIVCLVATIGLVALLARRFASEQILPKA